MLDVSQHLYLHGHMSDSSTLESSDSILDVDEPPAKKKRRSIHLEVLDKLKTCQKAMYKNFQGELVRHQRNSSKCSGNLCVDVLIFIHGNKICSDIACFLGLIFLS